MIKGVHVDCRAQKLKADALIDILKDLSGWGYNAILLEYMDAFPFEGELACLKAPDAFTKEEVIKIRETAKSLGIEIIPLVQTFGHLYWVLRHPEFMHLAEGYDPDHCSDEDVMSADGSIKFTTICPTHPGSLKLVKEMLRQTRELHPDSRYFHIGGDEIRRPSCQRCEDALKTQSLSALLAGHYSAVADSALEMGVTPIVWCDILMAFPETLDLMKGKVAVMDWDYWSNGQPTPETNLWGIRDLSGDNKNIAHEPDKWPELQQKLLRPYVFDKEPDTFKAFPYTDLLRDLGYEVILAGAARSAGDSFCVPSDMHLANSGATADKAAASKITGFVITSWAVRRQPWAMTEISLMLAAAHADGQRDDKATSLAFAKRHFGVEDEDLADLPRLLGSASKAAANGTNVLQALNEKSDFKTGNFFGPGYNAGNPTWHTLPRNEEIFLKKDQFLSGMADLKTACIEARKRLAKADSAAPCTEMWYWAVDVLTLYADAAPLLAKKKLEKAEDLSLLKELEARMETLSAATRTLYSKWYTDFTVEGEIQCRFTVLKDALEERKSGIKMKSLSEFSRLSLGVFPTPIQKLENISRLLGTNVYIKRDDMTGIGLGGNKVRKLEFLLSEAREQGAEIVFTTGGAQSNHAMLTAACCRKLGLTPILVLKKRGVTDRKGNLLLEHLMNTDVRFVDTDSYDDIYEEMDRIGQALGRPYYKIPCGGSNALGSLGYVDCVREIADSGLSFDHIVCAEGSGGTHAGIALGAKIFLPGTRVTGVMVDTAPFEQITLSIMQDAARLLELDFCPGPEDIHLLNMSGPGYAIPSEEGNRAIRLMGEKEGLFLDPVYTGKAFAGLIKMAEEGKFRPEDNVLFLYSGGAGGLFAVDAEVFD